MEVPPLPYVKPQYSHRVGLIIVAGLVATFGLFILSKARLSPAENVGANGQSEVATTPSTVPSLPESVAEEVERIVADIDTLSGDEKISRKRTLILLYAENGRFDLAGDIQHEIATELNTENEWRRTGNLYFDWMERRSGAGRVAYAKKAIAAYSNALEINPEDLDVRTDMAIAYLYDPENPMEAIRNTNMVLDQDSLHVQANFNKGIMLLNIQRFSEARAQFEKVLRLVGDENDPVYMRAQDALAAVAASEAQR